MKRHNELATAVIDHEEAMERAVAELLLDARRELSANPDGTGTQRQMRGHRPGAGADAEAQRR